jgi:hypothetical protein
LSTQHFEPGAPEYVQPLMEKLDGTAELIRRFLAIAADEKKELNFVTPSGGQTDGTGFAKWVAMEPPQGFGYSIHRINLEAINPATGLSYTPAAPFTAGWVGIFRGDPGFGGLIDFAPPNSGANVFPQISTDSDWQASLIRGERLWIQVTAGPVSTAVHATIRGRLFRL